MDLFFDLPIEILEILLDKLHVNDLLNCTLVCKSWRDGINQDFIWKLRCSENKYETKLMSESKSHRFIEDTIDSATELEESLGSLCYWREVYNWYSKLSSKWLNGTYFNYRLAKSQSPVYCLDCDGENLATGHEDANVHIWSVSTIPFHLTTIRCLLSDYPVLSIRINKNIVIALQKKLLQTYYSYNENKYILIDAKSFEVGENNIEQMDKIEQLDKEYESWYKECLRMNEIYSNKGIVIKLYEKSVYATDNCGILWSWSLPENEILNFYEINEENIRQIECIDGEVYIVTGLDVTRLLILDKLNDKFQTFLSVPGTKRFMIDQDLVLAEPLSGDNYLQRLWVWNKRDYYKKPQTRDILSVHHSAIIALHKFIVYSSNSQIDVWDPDQDVILSSFRIGPSVGFIRNCFSTVMLVFVSSNIFLWDWKSGKKICCLNGYLEWTGDFRNIVWIHPTMLITAGNKKQLEMFTFL